jgi:beta-lactamase regulating signal transducer with metallopeptidase domain
VKLASLELLSAAAVLGWLATYLIHSSLWLSGAWLVARRVRSAVWSERLWKGAVLGGLASAALVATLKTSRAGWSLEAPAERATPVADGLESSGALIALDIGSTAGGVSAPASNSSATPSGLHSEPSRSTPWTLPALDAMPWLVGLWLAGAALGLAHLGRQHRRLGRILASRRALDHGPLRAELERVKAAAGSRRKARLSVSGSLASPIALARGEIVVPARALERLSEREREVLLAHELAHLERRDPWWLLGLSLVERALFVQPLNRLATSRSVEAAEMACDELAARWTRGEVELARCLAEVASWCDHAPTRGLATALAERPSALLQRVERLLSPRAAPRRQGLLVGAWLVCCLAALACVGPYVTTTSPQEPEVPQVQAELEQVRILQAREPPPDLELSSGRSIERHVAQPQDEELSEQDGAGFPEQGVVRIGNEQVEYAATGQVEPAGQDSKDLGRERLEERIRRYLQNQSQGRSTEERHEPRRESIARKIADLKVEQSSLTPLHSRWQKAQSEIEALELLLAQLPGGPLLDPVAEDPRLTQAIDVLDDCPEWAMAFHVGVREDGVDPRPNPVYEHALELRADGSIWCGKMQMVFPGSHDERLLRFHLSEIARCMPKAPLSPARPDGPMLPDARLEIRIDQGATHSLLQRVLQACAATQVLIWKFALVPVQDGVAGKPVSFALPHDTADRAPNAESEPLEVGIRVLTPAPDGDPPSTAESSFRVLEYSASYVTAILMDEGGRRTPVRESCVTARRDTLAGFLQQAYAVSPRRRVVIDAQPGALYTDVVAVLKVVVDAGFTDISFVGLRQR